ncbi:unnamed protein product [Linum tenue]|uniref:F-box protein n=1 Tax=Linum tenue TaxID=586396 RepID=A0AAV0IJY8_9ROSI|nr:unnamed protein product [Linum tenue]
MRGGKRWMIDPSLEPLTTIDYLCGGNEICLLLPFLLDEQVVYSLKNGSWKSLTINGDLIPHLGYGGNYVHPQQQRDNHNNSQNQRRRDCYWFYAESGVCFTLSLDMTEERI